jgi:hypothetical protein
VVGRAPPARRFTDNAALREALGGRVVARLHQARTTENLFEVGLGRTIELYVPVALPGGVAPGAAGRSAPPATTRARACVPSWQSSSPPSTRPDAFPFGFEFRILASPA